ncbi:MAG TPA: pantoate--beta-alanine ligase [Acidimicrobiales bacterium]|nr:pantoate--beta-alanine ligase [Acidimicrobiales bacterium]
MPAVRVIGPGRAGLSLARALEGVGWDVERPLGRHDELAGAAEGVDLLVIAVPDRAVEAVAAAVRPVPTTVVAHLAGALGLDVLEPHRRRAAIHPLVPLPDPVTGAARLASGAWFAVAGDGLAGAVVEALGGRAVTVPDPHRVLHHAAAVIAANHLVALMGQVDRIAAVTGVPTEAYLGLSRAALADVEAVGPAAALTGPVARGDAATVRRHLAALDPSERPAYAALAAAAGRLVTEHGERGRRFLPLARLERGSDLRAVLDHARAVGLTVGLVPTMGALHEGHVSLIRRSAAECDVTAVSVFVNPLQFGPGEDLATYPRDLDGDLRLAAGAGADVVFAPTVAEMYPEPTTTTVAVDGPVDLLEGASRPGHFAGVATVVTKLFNLAGPCRAYFGEKDWQQLVVVRRLVGDLNFPVDVVGCPTVREPDGLACSSRNVRLSAEERRAATVLHRALADAAALVEAGERDPDVVRRRLAEVVATEPLARLDYAEVARAADLVPVDPLEGELRLLVAARVGATRLIDNLGVTAPAEPAVDSFAGAKASTAGSKGGP